MANSNITFFKIMGMFSILMVNIFGCFSPFILLNHSNLINASSQVIVITLLLVLCFSDLLMFAVGHSKDPSSTLVVFISAFLTAFFVDYSVTHLQWKSLSLTYRPLSLEMAPLRGDDSEEEDEEGGESSRSRPAPYRDHAFGDEEGGDSFPHTDTSLSDDEEEEVILSPAPFSSLADDDGSFKDSKRQTWPSVSSLTSLEDVTFFQTHGSFVLLNLLLSAFLFCRGTNLGFHEATQFSEWTLALASALFYSVLLGHLYMGLVRGSNSLQFSSLALKLVLFFAFAEPLGILLPVVLNEDVQKDHDNSESLNTLYTSSGSVGLSAFLAGCMLYVGMVYFVFPFILSYASKSEEAAFARMHPVPFLLLAVGATWLFSWVVRSFEDALETQK